MQARMKTSRQTVDLANFPELVVIYLGMKVRTFAGVLTLLRLGPGISRAVAGKPDGLLTHERVIFSLFPLHVGMRQYWRDFDSLEAWARTVPHHKWWQDFVQNSGGTGFWHEAYFMRGGMEAIYDDVNAPLGFGHFAPVLPAEQSMFSARQRLRKQAAKNREPES